MKKEHTTIVLLFSVFLFAACGGGDETTINQQQEPEFEAGDVVFHNADGAGFMMVYVPAKTFKSGSDDADTASVSKAFWIGETEVTYELWYTVRQWAISHGYIFANIGREGSSGTIGAAPTTIEPVTYINWRDAMIWCNAATEWHNAKNGTSYTCTYTSDENYAMPIRTATNIESMTIPPGYEDTPYIKAATAGNLDMANCTATGFRLMLKDEWELAARYINDINNDGDICDPGEYYPGNYASGATADYTNPGATMAVAWIRSNSGNETHAVKGLLPNALGVYDMSGNVAEFCFDLIAANYRAFGNGSYFFIDSAISLGRNAGFLIWEEENEYGFRIARTAD